MLTGNVHVYTEVITFQSILLLKGLRILLLTLPAPSRMKTKREGWEDHMWQQCQNVAMKPHGSLLCICTPGRTRARITTWVVAYGSPVRHVLFLWLNSGEATRPASCPHHQHPAHATSTVPMPPASRPHGKRDTWELNHKPKPRTAPSSPL